MADKPSHKAMLFLLEVLMNSNGPLTISQLAGRFGSRNFNGEMRQACGSNESGLKAFLLKYPSLFTLRGNMVSLCTSGSTDTHQTSSSDIFEVLRPLPDISAEMDAVRYFQQRMASRPDKWVSVRSVAGHLSQAPMHIRATVGPQLDFRNWLIRHPHIFDVRDEMVSLCDGVAALTNGRRTESNTALLNGNSTVKIPPKTPPAHRKTSLRRSKSFSEKRVQEAELSDDEGASFPEAAMLARKRRAPTTMTATEYKAIMVIRETIESNFGVPLASVINQFLAASISPWTGPQVEAFLRANSNVFTISADNMVAARKGSKLNVVITGSRPTATTAAASGRVLTGHKGRIFHVAKLWGIVDLGRHEHVFFDRSIMVRPLDDLKKVYSIGEMLYFNAVLAPKSSRAKWKAIRVWKESEQQPSANTGSEGMTTSAGVADPLSPSASVEEEMNRFFGTTIPAPTDDKFGDAAPSGAGAVPVWNFAPTSEMNGKPTMVPESYYMSASSLNDLHAASGSQHNGNEELTPKTYSTSSSQTISTGDIIATQLFQDQ